MTERRINTLEIMLLLYLIIQLVGNMGILIINDQYYEQFQQKLLVKGEIIEMDYYNITFPDFRFNILPSENITNHYYNLTIQDILSASIKYCSLEMGFVVDYEIEIGDVIYIYKNAPFIKIKNK